MGVDRAGSVTVSPRVARLTETLASPGVTPGALEWQLGIKLQRGEGGR